ncbi:hybrid sensor histidine kinase/response regulator [Pseudoroseomonas deserti]|uniref:histidine kinase n=1 Tax=Teichococcus deserti TaxID=1817963 RepID=A0A1V2H545_9PROT|nr:response regulator [Pseudoroseomonas deserti]ONG56186.1 hybrid sensor histidine kinase/response regulator [Pseudoroseomonas deserti]
MTMMPDPPATLLLVDDEPEILVALSDLLEDEFRVLTASSGPAALALLGHQPPGAPEVHAILSDQRMPEMTGDVFLARAREVCRAETLLLTGYADLDAVISAVNHGRIAGYAPKPWEPAALLSMVRSAVERFRLARALETERALLQGLLASSADALSFKDRGGRFIRLNAAKAQSLGRSIEASLGLEEAALLPEPGRSALHVAEAEAYAAGRATESLEQRHPAGAPAPRWIRTIRIPVHDGDGEARHLATIEHDITEQRLMEERLHQAEKMQALGTMAGGVAHDFNNLLTAILGSLELLLHSNLAEPRQAVLVRNAIKAAERGSTLTQRLLSFSRKRELQLRATDVNQLVAELEDLLLRSIGQAELRHRLDADLWPAMVDPEQLGLALLNLCINSRDAMPEGGSITIASRNRRILEDQVADLAPGDYVSLRVIDTGSGMSPTVLGQAFEPFFTTKEVGKGTGLGLSMVYGLTRQSGGTTTIASAPGEGTTVELLLPRANAPVEVPVVGDEAPAVPPRQATVLVVDDDHGVRGVTATFLADLGHRVLEVADGEAALALLQDGEEIGLLVTDFAMPRMTGTELAERARGLRPGLPVLVLTGYADAAPLAAGQPVLRKPFRLGDLAKSVETLLK